MLDLQQIKKSVSIVAEEYPIKCAELFGSYANHTNGPDRDVDLLVEFTAPRVSLLMLSSVKCRLEELLQTEVDVIHGPLSEDSMIKCDKRIPVYGA